MRRSVSETKLGNMKVRYRTRLEDEPSSPNSWEARQRLLNLFQTLSHSPDVLNCGFNAAQKINIYHSGESWVIEAEATVELQGS